MRTKVVGKRGTGKQGGPSRDVGRSGKATALALGPDNSSLIVANEDGVLII